MPVTAHESHQSVIFTCQAGKQVRLKHEEQFCRLRDEVRAKAREGEKLEQELTTVNALIATKDRALKSADDKIDSLNQRALKAEGASQILFHLVWDFVCTSVGKARSQKIIMCLQLS